MFAWLAIQFAALATALSGVAAAIGATSFGGWALWLVYSGPLYVTVPVGFLVWSNGLTLFGKVAYIIFNSSDALKGIWKLATLPARVAYRVGVYTIAPIFVMGVAVWGYLRHVATDTWVYIKGGARRNWQLVRNAAVWVRIRVWVGAHTEWMVAACFGIGLILVLTRYWRAKKAAKRVRKEALTQSQLNLVDYILNVLNVVAAVVGVAAFGWDAAKRAGFTSWVLRTWRTSMGAGCPRDFTENVRKEEKKKLEDELTELAHERAQLLARMGPMADQSGVDAKERKVKEALRAIEGLPKAHGPFVRPGLGLEEDVVAEEAEPLPVTTFGFFQQYGVAFLVMGAFTAIVLGLLYWVINPDAEEVSQAPQGKQRDGRVRREGEMLELSSNEEQERVKRKYDKWKKKLEAFAEVKEVLATSKLEVSGVDLEAKGDNKRRALRRNPSPDDVDLAALARDYEEAQAALEEAEKRWELRLDSYAVQKESMKTDLEKKFADYGVEMRKMDKVMNQLAEKTGATLVKLDTDISLLNRKMIELADKLLATPEKEALRKPEIATCQCGRPLGETNRKACPDCWKQKKTSKKAASKARKEALAKIEWTEVPVKKEALIASSALIQPTNQNAVVKISGKNPSSQVDFKNGFVANGTLVTCYHGPISDLQVESPQFGLPMQAVNVTDAKTDAKADWAMYSPPKGSPSTATCRQPKKGEKCFIRFYASPDATGLTMSEGIVESVGDGAAGLNGHHTCSTQRMASGAPIFAVTDGKVIGIHIGSEGQTNVFWPINGNGPNPRVSWLNKPGN